MNESVWLDPRRPGAALPGRKVMSLVHGMLAGGDSIDDMNVLRAGSTQLILGHRVMAPSTLGTFLRAFTFGHVRQVDRVLDVALCRAWQAGAGPGDGPLVIDIDSFIGPSQTFGDLRAVMAQAFDVIRCFPVPVLRCYAQAEEGVQMSLLEVFGQFRIFDGHGRLRGER